MCWLAELTEDCDYVALAEFVREATNVNVGRVIPVVVPRCRGWLLLTLVEGRHMVGRKLTMALSSSSWFKRSISRMLFIIVSDGWTV